MICKDCKTKPLARGVKMIKCLVCKESKWVNHFYSNHICSDCSDKMGICQYCSKEIRNYKTYIVKADTDKINDIKKVLNVTWESKFLKGLIFVESDSQDNILATDGILSCREEDIGTFDV